MGVMAIDLLNSDMFKSQGDVGKNFPSHYSSLKKKKIGLKSTHDEIYSKNIHVTQNKKNNNL